MNAHNLAHIHGLPPINTDRMVPQDRNRLQVFREVLRRDPPAPWTDNRLAQSAHFRGIPYIAIRAIYEWCSGSTVAVMKKRSRRRSAPVNKAMPSPMAQNQDDQYYPASDSHPIARLFEHINPVDTFQEFISQWIIQEELTGNVYIYIVNNGLGLPCEMWILPTALIQYLPMSDDYPMGAWRLNAYSAGNAASAQLSGTIFDAREVLHYRRPHPLYRWDGYSPLTAIGRQLDALEGIDDSRKAAMDHGMTPDAFVSIDGASHDEVQRVRDQIQGSYGGSKKHRSVFVADGSALSVEMMNTSPKDMDYQAGWEQMVKASLAGFNVPPAIAGLTEAPAYAAYYASLRQFFSNNLIPRTRRMASFLTKHLARVVDPKCVIQIDLPTMDDPDLLERMISADGQSGLLTYNEARALRNRSAVEGGDVPLPLYVEMAKQNLMPEPPPAPEQQGPPQGQEQGQQQRQDGSDGGPPQAESPGEQTMPTQEIVKAFCQKTLSKYGVK